MALLFLVWAVPEFRSSTLAKQYYENWYAAAKAGQNDEQGDAHFWVRELYGWVYAEDTLAQWLMVVLGGAASAISLYALIWLRRTWDQAKRSADAACAAVAETRRIGEAQVRAYLAVRNVSFRVIEQTAGNDPVAAVSFSYHNTGLSPATRVTGRFILEVFAAANSKTQITDATGFKFSSPKSQFQHLYPDVASAESESRKMAFEKLDAKALCAFTSARFMTIAVWIELGFKDVFGEPATIVSSFRLVADTPIVVGKKYKLKPAASLTNRFRAS
ncbi:hypothetical protein [Mesorhizobium sp. M7A.F.Ca.US.008.03.1.1]|uniref:hypothetical protein n=1 Tax=Mesorhizobium sp. M7A.F.Ca.US.008.03.1.1 TaxID=2496742 RepID=UPI000FC9DA05|nr:hypothetical protein [Mesorhizobium sp. M7A.F.Ca.US.008.03.1.1]RUW60183.1 hypothetical protein EOA16_19035 [Mesorhizobium sp. M7A.F.Ca.US.008.03.1.1]